MSAPLKHETEIPENETEKKRSGGERGETERGKFAGEALQKDSEADDEENGERNEKRLPKDEMPAQSG